MGARKSARGKRVAKHVAPRKHQSQQATTTGVSQSIAGRSEYDCPLCGGTGCLTVEPRKDGSGYWVNCWRPECKALGSSGDWLRALAAEVGAPGGGALKAEPIRYLGAPLSTVAEREPVPLPSPAECAGWHSRLQSEDDPLDYLIKKRRLTLDTIDTFCIGWDGEAFTFPVYDADGQIAQLIRRRWPAPWVNVRTGKRIPYKVLPGHGAHLYPQPLPEGGWLLVAGTLDAVIGQQHGLPTVTSICGTSFPERWHPLVRERKVYVMYDVGEERVMNGRVGQLREAGAHATAVRLSRLFRRGRGKDLSDALTGRYNSRDIINFIKRERRRAA